MGKKNEKPASQVPAIIGDALPEKAAANKDYILHGYEPPKNVERLNLPRLVKCGDIPVGATISGKLIKIQANISGKEDMREAKCLWLQTDKGLDFLFPMSGVIRKALEPNPEDYVGKKLYL